VDLRFSDGRQTRYDLVVASDGLYSKTRETLFPDAPKPSYTGLAVWRYNMPRPERVVWGELHVGPASKIGLVPLRPDLMYMYVVSAEAGNPRMPEEHLAELMRERTAGFSGWITDLVKLVVKNEEVVYKPIESLMLPAPWYKGRTLLIGDAAHATAPHLSQGAAMAIEDAVLLGSLLKENKPVEEILEHLMTRRFNRGKYVVQTSETIAAWELAAWAGTPDPKARSGELLYEASLALLEDY
jgi:2-polyprenyl-6-methoxyphenol hydroxylase-like FAD-dependent oxidoreductase